MRHQRRNGRQVLDGAGLQCAVLAEPSEKLGARASQTIVDEANQTDRRLGLWFIVGRIRSHPIRSSRTIGAMTTSVPSKPALRETAVAVNGMNCASCVAHVS